jgi:hypothetical protein
MKKLIIILTIIFIIAYPVFSQTLKSISLSRNKLSLNENTYTSVSIGGSIATQSFEKTGTGIGMNAGIRHQFSKIFYFEGKVDYFPKSSDNGLLLCSLIPQWSVTKSKSLNFILGGGLVFLAYNDAKILDPLFSTKLEYKISDVVILYPELSVPFYYVIPAILMGSINLRINIQPYQVLK